MFFNDRPIATEELKHLFDDMGELEVLELVEVDENGNLHFDINTYAVWC